MLVYFSSIGVIEDNDAEHFKEAGPGDDVPDVAVLIKSVEASLLGGEASQEAQVQYRVGVKLAEEERSPGTIKLKFSFELEAEPPVARLLVSGSAQLAGKEEELAPLLKAEGNQAAPPVFMLIYQKVYPVMYLLSGALKIPYPAPGLLKLSPSEGVAQAPAGA
jgi:hypothetical protein